MINISGLSDSRIAPVAAEIIEKEKNHQTLIIVSSDIRAERLETDLSFFSEKEIIVLEEPQDSFLHFDAKNHDSLAAVLKALEAVIQKRDCIIIVPVMAAIRKMIPKSVFSENIIRLQFGSANDPEEIKTKLIAMGYVRESVISEKGQFSVRGDIIDVFPLNAEKPYRIEFFDTEVDSIRSFDVDTQRSVENLKELEIYPAELLIKDSRLFEKAEIKLRNEYEKQIKKITDSLKTDQLKTDSLKTDPLENDLLKKNSLKKEKENGESDKKNTSNTQIELQNEIIRNLEERRDKLLHYISEEENLQQLEKYVSYFYNETETIIDYMNDATIIVDDPDSVLNKGIEKIKQENETFSYMLEKGRTVPGEKINISDIKAYRKLYTRENEKRNITDAVPETVFFTPFNRGVKGIDSFSMIRHISGRQTPSFDGRLEVFKEEMLSYIRQKYEITIVCSGEEHLSNVKEYLQRNDLDENVLLKTGKLSSGIDFPEMKKCWIRESDIFVSGKGKKRKARRKNTENSEVIHHFSDIKIGDYVVHENYGIGRFTGIEQKNILDTKKDCLKITYAGNDMVYVPVEHMDLVQKYVGSDAYTPKINKLSGGEWKKTKLKAKIAVEEMASKLLEMYAARELEKGHAFGPDTSWQKQFEEDFPYVETDDQLQAAYEIKSDMENDVAMDRILCGDVGFGKTEVAARAMFKCAAEGKQTALLVPTTILANQHYYTLKERFEKFPIKVEMLSRFRTKAQQQKIIEGLKDGKVDVIIGTHRLLSKDIVFKDLGLLVIDEEQRFGVTHKEKIKKFKASVDVLTLSATPIPRTLHMSLVGIKNMSVLKEPPEDRYPIQTYVMEEDEHVIQDAIQREIGRGGQVFVVYNRVRGLSRIASEIKKLVPDAEISIGHGQMSERELEDVLMRFINRDSNVLIATTIIESGIDIPNVNTMIVLDADRYGLSQLYQLRGRVGRSNRMAYAYLMYKKDKNLTEVSAKRLKAIRDFTEFGAGFKIAMRDLEIRGAGNLLGAEQHGHMIDVGYEMYCKLVDDAVRKLKGENVQEEKFQPSIELNVTAYIPDSYISDEVLKIQIYRRIAGVKNTEERLALVDELIDRFGDIPPETENLLSISLIKVLAEKACISRIVQNGKKVDFITPEGSTLNLRNIALAAEKFGSSLFIHGGVKPIIRYTFKTHEHLKELENVLNVFALEEDEDASIS